MDIYAAPKSPDWIKVCALLKVLPLHPELKLLHELSSYYMPDIVAGDHQYLQSADDFLVRPVDFEDWLMVKADHWAFSLRLVGGPSVYGKIPVADEASLSEFKRVVNEAIQGTLTQAEIERLKATEEHLKGCKRGESTEHWVAKIIESGDVALQHYNLIVKRLKNRPHNPDTDASSCRHKERLEALLEHGMSMLNA